MESSGALVPERENLSSVYSSHSSTNVNQQQPQPQPQPQQQQQQQNFERLFRPLSFDKMESLVKEMQDVECGVPVRSQKTFLTSIPSAFMGYDLIEWLMERLSIEESEALNIANQLCLHGYFFPVSDCKILVVKDDSSLYRFQTPYYWPWQHKTPDNIEYAIYLVKRSLRNKQRHGLEEYEAEALASLHKNLKGRWDFISMQAEEQVRLSKERKKGEKIVADSQERAFWRVHRPPPNQFTPLEPCPVPSRDRQGKPRKRAVEDCEREIDYLKASLGRIRMKMSLVCESLSTYWETYSEHDYFMQPALPSNPWVTEDVSFWQLNSAIVEVPTEKRVKRWSISIEELVTDPTGLLEFTSYLKKEYSHENIRFWMAVNDLRRSAQSQIARKVKDIYEEFLKPGAPCEINIDGKTMEAVQQSLTTPSRFTFDSAAEHIYALLLKKDCYPRFIRSEHYRSLLATGIQPSHKKRFFGFGGATKKKSTTTAPTNVCTQALPSITTPTQSNLTRRRGSDRSLSGSAHELAICGVKCAADKVPHSHSQNNLSDIPYNREVPKGNNINPQAPAATSTASSWVPPTEVPESSKVSVSICPWEDEVPTETPTERRSSQVSTVEPRSCSSDISDISERLRKSCGMRQNTLDSDMFSSQRLAPVVCQQRRASITTITPRLSAECKRLEPAIGCQPSLTSVSLDKADLLHSATEIRPFERNIEANMGVPISVTATPTIAASSYESVEIACETSEPIPFYQKLPEEENSSEYSLPISDTIEKTVTPTADVKAEEPTESAMLPEPTTSDSVMPVINVIRPIGDMVIAWEQPPVNSRTIDELESSNDVIDLKLSVSEDSDSLQKANIENKTEGDSDMFMENVGVNLTPGCVAPAPTPVPAMAPLAEDETLSVDEEKQSIIDEEPEDKEDILKQPPLDVDGVKRASKKKKEKGNKDKEVDRNPVCPWEDEDGQASSDGAFVKTYSTLGYL